MDDSDAERRKCGKDGNVFLRCSPVTYLRTSCLGRWEMGGGRQVGLNLEVERWKEGMCSWSCLGLPGPSGQVRSSGRIQIQIQVRLGRYGSWHVWVEWKQALSPTWQQTEGFHGGGGSEGREWHSGCPGTCMYCAVSR